MATVTVVCQEDFFVEVLIYTVEVEHPTDMLEVQEAITAERQRDLGSESKPNEMVPLFAFSGDMYPIADWR